MACRSTLTAAQLADLDKAFGLSKSPNAEIGHSWFKLVIVNNYQPGFPRLEEYLKTIGRRKLIEPSVRIFDENAFGCGAGQARVCQGPAWISSGNRQGHRSHRRSERGNGRVTDRS